MKTIKLVAIIIAIFSLSLSYKAWHSRQANVLSELAIANIEALAHDEGGGGSSTSWSCWSQEKSGSGYWRCGNPCKFIDGAGGKGTEGKCYAN